MNSFSTEQRDGKFFCTSYYFTECTGEGLTEEDAAKSLSNKIQYILDNDPKRFWEVTRKRMLEKAQNNETPLGIYINGKVG